MTLYELKPSWLIISYWTLFKWKFVIGRGQSHELHLLNAPFVSLNKSQVSIVPKQHFPSATAWRTWNEERNMMRLKREGRAVLIIRPLPICFCFPFYYWPFKTCSLGRLYSLCIVPGLLVWQGVCFENAHNNWKDI